MIKVEEMSVRAGVFQLDQISFSIPSGKCGTLMGATGAGKTTILEAICGLRNVLSGKIILNGDEVTAWPPAARDIGLVPQDHALFTTMTVREHLAFGPKIRKWAAAEITQRVESLAEQLGIDDILDRHSIGLSGGERQRVALGRALAAKPKILCLDEPLSAVDSARRDDIIALIKTLIQSEGMTTLHITHSAAEAEQLADLRFQLANGTLAAVD